MKKLAIGIDIGGINTAFGLVDEEGTIFCESAISTERYKKFDDSTPMWRLCARPCTP